MKSKLRIGFSVLVVFIAIVFAVRVNAEKIKDKTQDLFQQVQLFADSITLITTDYVEPVKPKDLIYGAIKGMMGTLDKYSQFLDPDSFKEITEDTKGEFGGIGIEVGVRDKVLTVLAPIEDTPAERAGLQKDDKIIKIDGELTRGFNLTQAVKKLKGDPGTKVTLTIYRKTEEDLIDFKIKRAIIKIKSIKDAIMIDDTISYISIEEFQERTAKDLRNNINRLMDEGAQGIILDLRNNPGGLLNASVEVADLFLKPGALIVYTEGRDKAKRLEFRSKKKSNFDDIKLVLLVNKASASASEILAGAIKDNNRGIVVGETTFGKGSVQTVIPLNDKSALRLTTASYYTPDGTNLRDKGIEPEIYVEKIKQKDDKKSERKPDLFDKLAEEGKISLEEDKDKTSKDDKKTKISVTKEIEFDKIKSEKAKELLKDNQIQAGYNVLKSISIFQELGSPVEYAIYEDVTEEVKPSETDKE